MNTPEVVILILSLAYFAPLAGAYIINKHPDLLAKGQDAAGRGMAIGCFSILLMAASAALAIAAAIVVAGWHKQVGGAWKVVGLLPLAASIIAAIAIYTSIVMARNRREQRNHEEAMSIPAALIVDDDDARFGKLFNAIKPSFPTLEISTRQPGALYWQQQEWFPRLRLLMLSADAMSATEGQTGELTQDLLAAMGRMKPACPILLHAQTTQSADAIKARLVPAGWKIESVIAGENDWTTSTWRPIAVDLLRAELERRPPPKQE